MILFIRDTNCLQINVIYQLSQSEDDYCSLWL